MIFNSQNPHYEYLRKRWILKHRQKTQKFLDKHADVLRRLTLGGLGGLMLLGLPVSDVSHRQFFADNKLSRSLEQGIDKGIDKNGLLVEKLKGLVPEEVRNLSSEEEEKITKVLSEQFKIPVKAEIEGIRLNRSYGLIGGEQHLYRYPGDNLMKHASSVSDWTMYIPAGIAPGLGAWGYFSPSEGQFDQKAVDRERYYIAVQTFLAPGFAENFAKYRDFFKFRKMLIINPGSGQSVVTDIGDAGPAEWTGKHLGGSPEVMEAVGLADGPRKGPVLYFFIDDPNDQIPLGPIQIKGDSGQ